MINLILSISIAAIAFTGSMLIPEMHWGFALFISLVFFFVSMVFLSRRIMKKIETIFLQAQKQAQSKQFQMAVKSLEQARPLAKWQVLLGSQIESQIGVFLYADRKEEEAVSHLEKGSPRSGESQMILAAIYFRRGDTDKMKRVMDVTLKFNKKNMLVYNAYAYMLYQKGLKDEAMQVLSMAAKKDADNDATRENLMKVQNGKKMNMKPFGMNWYSLQLEKPPISMMQDQFSGRAGFRQQRRTKKNR